jgi:hypothetical protein
MIQSVENLVMEDRTGQVGDLVLFTSTSSIRHNRRLSNDVSPDAAGLGSFPSEKHSPAGFDCALQTSRAVAKS